MLSELFRNNSQIRRGDLLKGPCTLFCAVPIFGAFERGRKVRKIPVFRIEIGSQLRPRQASKDERAAAQGERRGERTAQHHAPGAAIAPTLEACPGRNYEPISTLKTGNFLTFCPLSNASKIGTAQNKVYGTFNFFWENILLILLSKYLN